MDERFQTNIHMLTSSTLTIKPIPIPIYIPTPRATTNGVNCSRRNTKRKQVERKRKGLLPTEQPFTADPKPTLELILYNSIVN